METDILQIKRKTKNEFGRRFMQDITDCEVQDLDKVCHE
jgi:hypothetical protein